MQQFAASIGPLDARLTRVDFAVVPERDFEFFACLGDGTEVGIIRRAEGHHLVIDHRRDPSARARVEFWEVLGSLEGPVSALLVLADAARPTRPRP